MHLKISITLWGRLRNFLGPYSGNNNECTYSALYVGCTSMLFGQGKGKLKLSVHNLQTHLRQSLSLLKLKNFFVGHPNQRVENNTL